MLTKLQWFPPNGLNKCLCPEGHQLRNSISAANSVKLNAPRTFTIWPLTARLAAKKNSKLNFQE